MARSSCIVTASVSHTEEAHILRHLRVLGQNLTRRRAGRIAILRTMQVALQQVLCGMLHLCEYSTRRGTNTLQDKLLQVLASIQTANTTIQKAFAITNYRHIRRQLRDMRERTSRSGKATADRSYVATITLLISYWQVWWSFMSAWTLLRAVLLMIPITECTICSSRRPSLFIEIQIPDLSSETLCLFWWPAEDSE